MAAADSERKSKLAKMKSKPNLPQEYLVRIMDNLATVLISALVGFASSSFLMYIRDIYLHAKRIKEQYRRAIVEKQLENLYSPLYLFVKKAEFLLKKKTFTFEIPSKSGTEGRQKEFLDSIVEKYLYLAEDDLMALLPKSHGVGYYKEENKKTNEQVVDLIVSGYERLRKEYFALGGIPADSPPA